MHERVKTINKYYINLEYDTMYINKKNEALEQISALSRELNFKNADEMSYRFFHTASLIEKYLNLFKSACEHVDIITTILDYLYYFDGYRPSILLIMLTFYSMYMEDAIYLFLETAIIPESQMETYCNYKKIALQHFEMILLEDSDLYAVINCLKLRRVLSDLSKIWIQESIIQTFIWHFKKCFGTLNIPIHIFQSKQELLVLNTFKCNINMTEMNIMSIWSEDVVAAKTLAESLNQDVLFINTHMDFCPGIIFPYIDKYVKSLDESLNLHQMDEYKSCVNPVYRMMHKGVMFDLFYNGKWQTPINNTYWIHDNVLFANAFCEDIIRCANSAIDGFKTWSTMSAKSRMKILSNFANTLECNGNLISSTVIFYWIKMSYICGSKKQCYQNERFEVIKAHKPQGTVILREKDETTFFRELTQSLIIGNSVIVICDPNFCTLTPYCDMFKMCGIPPGVINLLSRENTNFRYDIIRNSTVSDVYSDLTIIKHIIISLK